jgi:hypothetical protein
LTVKRASLTDYLLHFDDLMMISVTIENVRNCLWYINIFQLNFQIESVAIGLIHRPPSWYRLSLTTSMNSHAKIIFLQEDKDKSRIFLFFNYDQGQEFEIPFELVPSRTYYTRVLTVTRQNNTSTASSILIFDRVKFSNLIEFKACEY